MSKKKHHHKRKSAPAHHAHHHHHKRRRTRRKSLSGIDGLLKDGRTGHEAMDEALKAGMVVSGILAGSAIGNFVIDKFLPPDDTSKIKLAVKPLVLIGSGVALSIAGKKNALMRHAGYGVAIAGAASGVKRFLKKDLFAGLGEADDPRLMGHLGDGPETNKKLLELVAENSFRPALPAVNGPDEEPQMKGPFDELRLSGAEEE